MKYIDEFRNEKRVNLAGKRLAEIMPKRQINLMEVCGTHTQSFYRFALDKIMPANLKLIAGPGCPVCVSSAEYIDQAIGLARDKENIILTFGDMLRLPGGKSSLEKERANGGDIRVVYSPMDALEVAGKNINKRAVFLAVGFETTAPAIGLSILMARKKKLNNIYFLCALKLITPALDYLARDKKLGLSGFLCPGHVSCIIGSGAYDFIPQKYRIGCCVAGFEPLDILEGLYLLVKQINDNSPRVDNQYMRAVTRKGNVRAQKIIRDVFEPKDEIWRGLGELAASGLKIRNEFRAFDAEKVFGIKLRMPSSVRRTPCRCGDVLKGVISPADCGLFPKTCSPDNPIGPCMVSSEGACNAYYRYKRN